MASSPLWINVKDEQLLEVGRATVLWAFIEGTMDEEIECLQKKPAGRGPLSVRVELWCRLTEEKCGSELGARVSELAARIAQAQETRNTLVHGAYAGEIAYREVKSGVVDIDISRNALVSINTTLSRLGADLLDYVAIRATSYSSE